MNLPGLSKLATFALKISVKLASKALADGKNPLTKEALADAVKAEAQRQVLKRLGA